MDEDVRLALLQAYQFAEDTIHPNGHWCGELKSNCTITAEYVLLLQALGLHKQLSRDRDALQRYFLSEQNPDGSWSNAPEQLGNTSTTVETFLALKILGLSCEESESMQRARRWVRTVGGGVEKVRVFTRMYLAQFGLFPWTGVPELPAELALMPIWSPINIYKLSSWARSTIMPLLVVNHHRPLFALPNGCSPNNGYLDELWLDATFKHVPYHTSIWDTATSFDCLSLSFILADKAIGWLGGLRRFNPLRKLALDECMRWIKSRQEREGDWAGIFPPMHLGILAYILSGYKLDDAPVRRALEAIERFVWQDEHGKRVQACVSPVWDTVLMASGLAGADCLADNRAVSLRRSGLDWVKQQQVLGSEGDWRIYRPGTTPGGFSFEYFNKWYPDVDDTCAAIIAFLKDDPNAASSQHVLDAVKWVLGMQCGDGGWAAFDVDNDSLWLNRIPFSDMDALCDPPTPDIVGRVLEAFGLLLMTASHTKMDQDGLLQSILRRVRQSSQRGVRWIANAQRANGSWYGRWGVNYIYGTSNVLAGLAYFCHSDLDDLDKHNTMNTDESHFKMQLNEMVKRAVQYILSIQNEDGGWGESTKSYISDSFSQSSAQPADVHHTAPSTPSQTAWGLIGIIPYLSINHPAVERGVRWLIERQVVQSVTSATFAEHRSKSVDPLESPLPRISRSSQGKTWDSRAYTGTGFPNHFYLGYTMYSHYFPMIALTEYHNFRAQEIKGARSRTTYI